jgi:hypothetical protein
MTNTNTPAPCLPCAEAQIDIYKILGYFLDQKLADLDFHLVELRRFASEIRPEGLGMNSAMVFDHLRARLDLLTRPPAAPIPPGTRIRPASSTKPESPAAPVLGPGSRVRLHPTGQPMTVVRIESSVTWLESTVTEATLKLRLSSEVEAEPASPWAVKPEGK